MSTFGQWITSDSVRDNAVVTFAVGGPLSVYLAVLVNRLASFRQIKTSALAELATMAKPAYEADSCLSAQISIRSLLEVPPIALHEEGQVVPAKTLKAIQLRVRAHFLTEFERALGARGLTNYADLRGVQWVEAMNKIISDSRPFLRKAVKDIQAIQPDWLVTLGVPGRLRYECYTMLRYLLEADGYLCRVCGKYVEQCECDM